MAQNSGLQDGSVGEGGPGSRESDGKYFHEIVITIP